MFHKVYKPTIALREFVNNIMIFRLELDNNQPRPVFSFPPMPEQCLYFYPFDSPESEYLTSNKIVKLNKSIVVGPQINRIKLKMNHNNFTIKVGFQPSGLYRLLGIPMNELPIDESLDSCFVLGNEIKFINEQLSETQSYDKMIEIVEAFLLKKLQKLRPKLPLDNVLPSIIAKGGLINIDDLASQACVSTRQLERQFQQRVGIQPKFYARLTRFAKAWVMKENIADIKWTAIAHECGYFDQMHLIRDFKSFCGVAPSIIEDEFKATPYLLRNRLYY